MSRLSHFVTQAFLFCIFLLPLVITKSSMDALLSTSIVEQTEVFSLEGQSTSSRPPHSAPFDHVKGMDFIPLNSL